MQHHGNGGEDPGERWLSLENLSAEIHSLTHLEGELNSSLLFEHGGRQRASPLWVVCILLSRLFREWLALGRAVEVFVKYQRWEAMRSMVKLQDLVDFSEPPLGGTSGALTSYHRKDEAMELDEEDVYQDEATAGAQFSSGEANFGLG